MASTDTPQLAACPACVGLPEGALQKAAQGSIAPDAPLRRAVLSVPAMHCAACITCVEEFLSAQAGVQAARVNLSLKRVTVTVIETGPTDAELAALLDGIGYPAQTLDGATLQAAGNDRAGKRLLAKLGVAGFAMMNVMLLSVSVWSGAEDATRDLMHWVSALIAFPTVLFSATPFFTSAWSALRHGRLNMDVPITLAILLALGLSLTETIESGQHAYFDAALSLTFFLLLGRYLDHRTRAVARSAAAELAALDVMKAMRVNTDGTREEIPADAVKIGDVLAVAAGERVPADGPVVLGHSDMDRAMLTGESLPVTVGPGDQVHAGMVNLTGPLQIKAETLGEDTLLKQIARLVETAEGNRNRYTRLADRAAKIYAPGVHLLSLFTFIGWWLISGDLRHSLNIAVSVLIITCPCALGLAVPSVQAAASGLLFRLGVLVKDGAALEKLAEIDHVVFDKTGTLTEDLPRFADGPSGADMQIAHGLARESRHPLSRALANAAQSAGIPAADITAIREEPGLGLSGDWHGTPVKLGRADWLGAEQDADAAATWLKVGDAVPVRFRFDHALRDGAEDSIAAFKAAGLPLELLSGDSERQTARIAEQLGFDRWQSGITPQGKVARVQALNDQGHHVLMVGDGLNDGPALAAAHVSMSPASAMEASRAIADMILLGGTLERVARAYRIAKSAKRRILENFALAAAYNAIAIPIAVLGHATPLLAALAMSASSICVTLNALRLRSNK